MRASALTLVIVSTLVLAAGCGSDDEPAAQPATSTGEEAVKLPQGNEPVKLDSADFVAQLDNPYWPLVPGSKWIYRETDGEGGVQKVEITVTDRQKTVVGIDATVVHDVVTEDGDLVEETWDWYGQDEAGNLWYLGEDTKEYENGKVVSTEGSWEAGVDGAQAGIIMPADPEIGLIYRQEYYEGEAEDSGQILRLTEKVSVPFGSFDQVLMTKDYTPLDPDLVEHKFYAKGVGPVLVLEVSGGTSREELIRYEAGS
jgi:hypothetical protein